MAKNKDEKPYASWHVYIGYSARPDGYLERFEGRGDTPEEAAEEAKERIWEAMNRGMDNYHRSKACLEKLVDNE